MKKLTSTLFAALLLISASSVAVCAQNKTEAPKLSAKDQIVGIWIYRGIVFHDNGKGMGDDQYRETRGYNFKIISADGTYSTMTITPNGAIITGSGTYKVPNDSTYVEHVTTHMNSTMVGKDNKMVIHFSPDGSAMSSQFLLEQLSTGDQVNVTNTEYWERIVMPNPMKKPSKLNPKQKIDGMTDADLEQEQIEPQNTHKDIDGKTKMS